DRVDHRPPIVRRPWLRSVSLRGSLVLTRQRHRVPIVRRTSRRLIADAFTKIGLATPALRVYEMLLSAARTQKEIGDQPFPLPPPRLRVLVAGRPSADWFLASGERAAEAVLDVAGPLAGQRILEFGCGCGRVLRHLVATGADVYGCDYNAKLLTWCQENLPGTYSINSPKPPLPYPDGFFDVVYTISVFTHLARDHQQPWLAELARITSRDGSVLITTQGNAYRSELRADELAVFESGDAVARREKASGLNLCSIYHPPTLVEQLARSAGLDCERSLEARVFRLDLHVLRKYPSMEE
ncbi:MAG: class I SAM-dependent methyltransferase, partial [Ardenticatenaceae bacterium]